MKITCISDLHGHLPKLSGGDLLIVAGDLTAIDLPSQHLDFIYWLSQQNYIKKIFIAGNHDDFLMGTKYIPIKDIGIEYLCDSGTEFEGFKIWGCPYTQRFEGQNPECMAFTVKSDLDLREHFDLIPPDTNILITHSPPYGVLDKCDNGRVGSKSLRNIILSQERLPDLKLHVFGHIHEMGGKKYSVGSLSFINAAVMNNEYQPINKIMNITLPDRCKIKPSDLDLTFGI